MDISTPEFISLALIGATTKAAQLRASNTQPDALTRLEQSVIPELSVLSLTDDTTISSEKLMKKNLTDDTTISSEKLIKKKKKKKVAK